MEKRIKGFTMITNEEHRKLGQSIGLLPKVSIIYLSFRRLDYCSKTFKALVLNTTYKNKEVIVVDQGGDPDVRDYFISMQEQGYVDKLILNNKNMGCGYASNEAFRLAEGDYLAYVQNDMLLMNTNDTWIEDGIALLENANNITPLFSENKNKKVGYVSFIAEDERTCPKACLNNVNGIKFVEKSSDMHTSYNDHPFIMTREVRNTIGEYSYGGHGPWIDHFPHNEGDYQSRFLSCGYYGIKTVNPRFGNIGSVTVMENYDGSVWHRECVTGWVNDGKAITAKYKWLVEPEDDKDKFDRHLISGVIVRK